MKILKSLTLVAAMTLISGNAVRATVIVDGLTATQLTMQNGAGLATTTASGADILGGTRTQSVFVDSQPSFSFGAVSTGAGLMSGILTGPNSPVGNSYFDLSYTTSAIDAATGNLGFYFQASSNGGSLVTITANGTSTSSVTIPSDPGVGNYFVSLASFSDATVFSALTSLDIKATFSNVTGSGPSLTLTGPIVIASIPEPSVLALASVACLSLGALRLRRKA